ncbi:MAG: di-trans,poly-cis-decaprenylcistransferase [Spirochaetales bacterium]|nr:di-trans,poly-cis-decaprenylcistransferase [Spirochaetales bacterium]
MSNSIPEKRPDFLHIGIIMDGNGRWAVARNKPRTFGHKEGLEAAKRVVKAASDLGIGFVSLYTFSTENWKRTTEEVSFLMKLIGSHLKKEWNFYRENKIRVVHSGDLSGLPEDVSKDIIDVIRDTADFPGLTVNLAINYGGRNEIVRGINKWISENPGKPVDEEIIAKCLDNPELPEPDIIIRTGGEKRLSNFLLWGSAYSEYIFTDTLWPDWTEKDLEKALQLYAGRDRRFGGVN